ncbi:MAG: hypothetical protein ABIU05_02045 [Nitrospirales bacterium]
MASRYRKIDPRIWTDEKFRQFTAHEQRICLYILTAQSNRIGLFSFSPGKACEDLGTLPLTFRKGFDTVCQALHWEWDPESRVLYLPTWWRYNPPENANNVIGNLKDLDDLPETTLLERFSSNTAYLSGNLIETFTETLAKRSPKRSPSQEQEQEQEQEGSRHADLIRLTPEQINERWNAIPGIKPCKTLGKTIRDRIQARLRENPSPDWWTSVLQQVRSSDFLCGRTNGARGPFHASLTWILAPTNFDKLLAGDYDPIHSHSHGASTTCSKRIQGPDDRFLRPCGQPASPGSRTTEPRCAEHVTKSVEPKGNVHVAH